MLVHQLLIEIFLMMLQNALIAWRIVSPAKTELLAIRAHKASMLTSTVPIPVRAT